MSMLLGAIVLLVIVLAVFTDLGLPPDAQEIRRAHQPAAQQPPAAVDPRAGSSAEPQPAAPGHTRRVDGILLRTPAARPRSH